VFDLIVNEYSTLFILIGSSPKATGLSPLVILRQKFVQRCHDGFVWECRLRDGTVSALNCEQELASIPMAQGGLTRLAIARLKSAGVPVAPLLDRVRGIAPEEPANGAVVRTDGWKGYDDLQMHGYTHEPLVLDGDPERAEAHLPMIHIAFSNLKTWLLGKCHRSTQPPGR
jgi:hypothetical protein